MEVALVGDSQETLRALIPLLQRKQDRSWRDTVEKSVRQWGKTAEALAMDTANPLNPRRVFFELSPKLPDDVILTADSGSGTSWFAQYLQIRKGMMASLSGNLATMGCAVPYAIGAKFAFPHRPVLAVAGDGAMQMSGNGELVTVAKYWREWKDPRFIVLVLNNRDLNMVTWEQRVLAGDPKLPATQDLPDFPYARYAESIGLKGIRVDRPESLSRAWDEALSFDGMRSAINVFRIDVVSNESGADDPVACGGSGASPATYFDSTFCGASGAQRLLVADTRRVMAPYPWSRPTVFAAGVGTVAAASLIQSNHGSPGNLEVVARIGERLAHSYRDSGPRFAWNGPFFFT